jgi:hypothetical protein
MIAPDRTTVPKDDESRLSPETRARIARIRAELQLYGGALLPQGIIDLGRAWSFDLGSLPRPLLAAGVADRLEKGGWLVERSRNPEYVDPFADKAPVRRTLARYAGELRDGAIDELTAKWGDLNVESEKHRTKEVLKRLERRDNAGFLRFPPPRPAHVQRVRDVLHEHFGEEADVDAMAEEWANEFQSFEPYRMVRFAATRLANPTNAAKFMHSGLPLSQDDPRRNLLERRKEAKSWGITTGRLSL